MAERLADHGFIVEQAGNGEDALAAPGRVRLRHPDHRPASAWHRRPAGARRRARALSRRSSPIVITGFGTVKDAVDAIKQGAADFITKPFQFDALLHVLQSALEQRRLKSENAYLRSQLEERYRIDGLVGRSTRHARPVAAARDRRGDVEHGADHRRDRHRQGARARAPFTTTARGARSGSSRSTAARFPRRCSRRSSSATSAARSPARSRRGRAASSRRTKARCSSTRSGR